MPVDYLIGLVFQDSSYLLSNSNDLTIDRIEITSIAWTLIDIDNHQTLCLDQNSVCPSDLSGFNSHQLDIFRSSPPLEDILVELESKFSGFIGSLDHACIITIGPITLRQLLHPEAVRKNIPLHKLFYSYFDLQKEYKKCYSKTHIPKYYTITKIVRNLAMSKSDYVSRCDIDDAKMLSKIVQNLLEKGHLFREPNVINPLFIECPFPQRKFIRDESVLKIRGMPFEATFSDIAKFFSGLNICSGGILILLSRRGLKTGEALVLFEDEENSELAYRRNKCHMASRYIEILHTNSGLFRDISLRYLHEQTTYAFGALARLRGLPFKCNEEAICQFISRQSKVYQGCRGVLVIENENSLPSGDAFVLFEDEDDLDKAMILDRTNLHERYIEIFRSNIGELLQIASRQILSPSFSKIIGFSHSTCITPIKRDESMKDCFDKCFQHKDCVRLRGLPYSATVDDVLDFFGTLADDILPRGIHFVYNQKCQPTGECYVQMNSYDSAQIVAHYLHRKFLNSRYIEVYVSSNHQIQRKSNADELNYNIFDYDDICRENIRNYDSKFRVKLRGLPFKTSKRDVAIFLEDYAIDEEDIVFVDDGFRKTGIAFVFFTNGEKARRAIRDKNHKFIGDRYIELFEAF